MADYSIVRPSQTGGSFAVVTGANGDTFTNTGKEILYVKNTHATNPLTVTIDAPGQCSFGFAGLAQHDLSVTVPAVSERLIGPFDVNRFNDANGKLTINTFSTPADSKVAALAFA